MLSCIHTTNQNRSSMKSFWTTQISAIDFCSFGQSLCLLIQMTATNIQIDWFCYFLPTSVHALFLVARLVFDFHIDISFQQHEHQAISASDLNIHRNWFVNRKFRKVPLFTLTPIFVWSQNDGSRGREILATTRYYTGGMSQLWNACQIFWASSLFHLMQSSPQLPKKNGVSKIISSVSNESVLFKIYWNSCMFQNTGQRFQSHTMLLLKQLKINVLSRETKRSFMLPGDNNTSMPYWNVLPSYKILKSGFSDLKCLYGPVNSNLSRSS